MDSSLNWATDFSKSDPGRLTNSAGGSPRLWSRSLSLLLVTRKSAGQCRFCSYGLGFSSDYVPFSHVPCIQFSPRLKPTFNVVNYLYNELVDFNAPVYCDAETID